MWDSLEAREEIQQRAEPGIATTRPASLSRQRHTRELLLAFSNLVLNLIELSLHLIRLSLTSCCLLASFDLWPDLREVIRQTRAWIDCREI
jgi:hypothetical protein